MLLNALVVDQPLLSRLFRKVSLHRPCHKFAVSYQKQLSEAVMSCERSLNWQVACMTRHATVQQPTHRHKPWSAGDCLSASDADADFEAFMQLMHMAWRCPAAHKVA